MAKQVNIFKFFGSMSSKRNINVIKPKQHEKDEKIIRNVVSDLINDVVKGENKDKKSTTDFAYCLEKATRWKMDARGYLEAIKKAQIFVLFTLPSGFCGEHQRIISYFSER